MIKGKKAKKTSDNSEVRAQVWEKVLLDLFSRHHGIKTKREIAKLLGRSESTVNAYFRDPAGLGDNVVELIAAAFERLEIKEYIFSQWKSLQLSLPDDPSGPTARRARRRRQSLRDTFSSIDNFLRIETVEHGRFVALTEAYARCMLNTYFWQAASYIPEMEDIAEKSGDTVALARCQLLKFRVLRTVGFSNIDHLIALLRRAQQLLDSSTQRQSQFYRRSTVRIETTIEQVAFACERLSYEKEQSRAALTELDGHLTKVLPEAETKSARAEIYIRKAQIQACLGNVQRAEALLAKGRTESNGKAMRETHAVIIEIMILRAKGENDKAVALALEHIDKKPALQDEFHKRVLTQQVVEIIVDCRRYGTPVP